MTRHPTKSAIYRNGRNWIGVSRLQFKIPDVKPLGVMKAGITAEPASRIPRSVSDRALVSGFQSAPTIDSVPLSHS